MKSACATVPQAPVTFHASRVTAPIRYFHDGDGFWKRLYSKSEGKHRPVSFLGAD